MKKLLVVVGAVVAVLVGFLIAVIIFFPKEKIRALAIEQGSKALGRPIEVGDVSVTLWGGFGAALNDLVIGNPSGMTGDPLASIKSIDVKVALFPLLSGSVQVDRLIIEKPVISLMKQADGKVNYQFKPDTSNAATTDTSASNSGDVAVGRIELRDGRLSYRDDSSQQTILLTGLSLSSFSELYGTTTTMKAELDIDSLLYASPDTIALQDLSTKLVVNIDSSRKEYDLSSVEVSANPLSVTGSGKISTAGKIPNGNLAFSLKSIGIDKIMQMLPNAQREKLTGYTVAGDLSGDGTVTLSGADSLETNFTARMTVAQLVAKSEGIAGELQADSLLLSINKLRSKVWLSGATFDHQPISFTAELSNEQKPFLDAAASGMIDVAMLKPLMAGSSMTELSGRASLAVTAKGDLSDQASLQTAGTVSLQDIRYHDSQLPEPITDLDADLSLDNNRVAIRQLSMKFPSSDLTLTGTAEHLIPWLLATDESAKQKVRKPDLTFTATSNRFDSDKLFPEATPGGGVDSVLQIDSIPSLLFPDILGQGTFVIDTMIYCKLDLTDIRGKVAIKDRVIQCTDVTGKLYSGTIDGSTAIDFSDYDFPVYAGAFSGAGIEANDFMTRFTPLQGVLFGKADLKGTFGATGWEASDFLKSLTLDGNSLIRSAKLMTSGVVRDGLTALAGKAGVTFDGEQAVRELTAKFKVENGRVHMEPFSIPVGELGTVQFGGSYGFDKTAAGLGNIQLSESASQKLAASGGIAAGLLGGKNLAISLPFAVGGSITSPTFSIDYQKAAANTAAQAKQAAETAVKDAVKGTVDKGLDEAGKKVDSTLKKSAEGLLKGLLKKP